MSSHGVDTATRTAGAPSTTGAAPDELDLLAVFTALPGPAAVFAADAPRFTLLAASDALVGAAQRSREALVGRPLADAFPDDSPEPSEGSGLASLRASLEAATRTRAPQRMARQRYDLRRPDGAWETRYWDALNTPVPGPGGAVRYVLHQTEDVTARVLAEQERGRLVADAARAERRAARVLEQVSDAVVQMDRAFRIVDVNPATERALGTPRAQLVGRSHWEAFPGSVGGEPERQYRRVQAEGVEAHFTHHYVDAARDFVAEVDAYPADDGGVAVFWRDVTARRRAEAALGASEARFRTVQDASPLGFAIHRPVREAGAAGTEGGAPGRVVDFTTPYVNAAGARIAGHSPEAILAGTVLAIWPWLAQEGVFADYVRVLETGEPAHRELLFEQDGLAAGFAITAVRIGSGPEAELGTTFTDVTARLRAEGERARLLAELTAERERLRALILHMPAPVALTEGPEHRFVLVNDAYKRASGGGRDVTGLTPREAFPELAGSGIHELFDQVYATGTPWVGPETLVRYNRDGTGVQDTWFDLRLEPVREAGPDGGGRVVAILVYNVDVTAQVVARRAVEGLLADAEAARAEAERANRAKSEFLAVMSHELRTPLNAIGGYAELMEMGIRGPVTAEQRADLERIQRAQRHLLGLINGVLNYAKIDAGAVHYHLEAVALDEVLAACEALVAPQVRAKGLALRREGDGPSADGSPAGGPPLRVRADREKLQQVVLNLLSNAVKFTEPGGALALRCAVVPAGADGPGGAAVRIQVADTGIGIAPDQLGRVFEPFVQVDQRLTRAGEGTGLGLAISRDLARGMGGDLTAESTPGVGSTFTLTLPCA